MTNAEYARSDSFIKKCNNASETLGREIKPTARQASKYRRGFGIVRKTVG